MVGTKLGTVTQPSKASITRQDRALASNVSFRFWPAGRRGPPIKGVGEVRNVPLRNGWVFAKTFHFLVEFWERSYFVVKMTRSSSIGVGPSRHLSKKKDDCVCKIDIVRELTPPV